MRRERARVPEASIVKAQRDRPTLRRVAAVMRRIVLGNAELQRAAGGADIIAVVAAAEDVEEGGHHRAASPLALRDARCARSSGRGGKMTLRDGRFSSSSW